MIELRQKPVCQLENHHRQSNRKHQTYNHEEQVIQNRVADICERGVNIRRKGQVSEVIQANPRTFNKTIQKLILNKSICGRSYESIGFERHDNAGHGEIRKQQQPHSAR